MEKKLIVNSDLCTGCLLCEVACSNVKFNVNNPKKAAIGIIKKKVESEGFEIIVCKQCGICMDVCPQDAIYEKEGIYYINADKCTNCGVCVEKCPNGSMFVHEEIEHPIKCDWCGKCVELCPTGALEIRG